MKIRVFAVKHPSEPLGSGPPPLQGRLALRAPIHPQRDSEHFTPVANRAVSMCITNTTRQSVPKLSAGTARLTRQHPSGAAAKPSPGGEGGFFCPQSGQKKTDVVVCEAEIRISNGCFATYTSSVSLLRLTASPQGEAFSSYRNPPGKGQLAASRFFRRERIHAFRRHRYHHPGMHKCIPYSHRLGMK